MMRSLYSGVSGLRSHQTRMDVIGANIANVNTVGFKASRVTFRDVLYQTMANATSPVNADEEVVRGGTNPYQIGLGTQIASIDMLNTRAGPQVTDRPLDVYIDGEGYFKVTVPTGDPDDLEGATEYFTRVGNFALDEQWQLVDSNGNYVMGINAVDGELEDDFEDDDETVEVDADTKFTVPIKLDIDPEDPEKSDYTNIAITMDGLITGYNNYTGQVDTLGKIIVYKFTNNDGLYQCGNTYYQQTMNSGSPVACHAGFSGAGGLATNRLEMSNVELSKEFTDMIVTQRGFQANSRVITVSDEMLQELVSLKR